MKKRLIDTHCDTLMFYSQDFDGFVGGPWKVTLDKMSTYDAYLGTFAMYYDLTQTQQQRLEQAQAYRKAVEHLFSTHPVHPVRTVQDLDFMEKEGGCGVLLSIENACVFEDDDKDLQKGLGHGRSHDFADPLQKQPVRLRQQGQCARRRRRYGPDRARQGHDWQNRENGHDL